MKVTILNKPYNLKTEWQEITLEDSVNLLAVELPQSLKKCYDALLSKDKKAYQKECEKLTANESIKEHPAFFGEVISLLSDIPKDIIDTVGWESRTEWYHNFFEKIYLDCYFGEPSSYKAESLKSFTHKDVEYFFPESLKIFNKEIPMHKESAVSFAEEADIMASVLALDGIGIGGMAQVSAVMCREKGEDYDEDKAISRAENFKDLPMNIVWEVFFYIIKQCNISANLALTSLRQLNEAKAAGLISE